MFQQRYGWNVGEEDNLALRQSDTPMAINLGEHNYYQPFRGLGSLFGAESSGDKVFGVQRHDAHRAGLHYDLRLERDGVLKSWSIPKGMPTDKRHLAIETPDHKMSWLDFEGEIKEGYGAGDVKLDSKSTFKTVSYKPKKWVFYVNSGKYQGKYTLVHWKDDKWLISRNKDQSLAAENAAYDDYDTWHQNQQSLHEEKWKRYHEAGGKSPITENTSQKHRQLLNDRDSKLRCGRCRSPG